MFCRLTTWFTNESIVALICARSAAVSCCPAEAVAGRPSKSATTAARNRPLVFTSNRLAANEVEQLVPLALHRFLRPCLEVEPEQGLGVGRPHVHVPVVRVDRETVEVPDAALRSEALLELAQLRVDVGDTRVDLTADEVALAERAQDLRQPHAFLRDELEHQQKRDHARIGLREVAEVVVAGDLAPERGVLLAHPLLDERVP